MNGSGELLPCDVLVWAEGRRVWAYVETTGERIDAAAALRVYARDHRELGMRAELVSDAAVRAAPAKGSPWILTTTRPPTRHARSLRAVLSRYGFRAVAGGVS